MEYEQLKKMPGDLISADDWNEIIDELESLRTAFREGLEGLRKEMGERTYFVTLQSLESPINTPKPLNGNGEAFTYGTDVLGLITGQFYLGKVEEGEICKFGLHDFADTLYYWAGTVGDSVPPLRIILEYLDNTAYTSRDLHIHDCLELHPKGNENPYGEFLASPNGRVMYRYPFANPHPEKAIRYITFEDVSKEAELHIGNILHYATRIRPLPGR
ncbi:MAG: hypothetical protein QCH35_11245 [Methanomicrobiaceae archaeon]|nr:hypothetical protein [Methanomicrobiaceae archaeon]